MTLGERTLPEWERKHIEALGQQPIETVEQMGYEAAKRRVAIRRDEIALSKPLTPWKSIPTGSRIVFQGYVRRLGYTGELARYLRRRFETKYHDMVEIMRVET